MFHSFIALFVLLSFTYPRFDLEWEEYQLRNQVSCQYEEIIFHRGFLSNMLMICLSELQGFSNNREIFPMSKNKTHFCNPLYTAVIAQNQTLVRYYLAKGYSPGVLDSYIAMRPIDQAYRDLTESTEERRSNAREICSLLKRDTVREEGEEIEGVPTPLIETIFCFLKMHYKDRGIDGLLFNTTVYEIERQSIKDLCAKPLSEIFQAPSQPSKVYFATHDFPKNSGPQRLPKFLVFDFKKRTEILYTVHVEAGTINDPEYMHYFHTDFSYQFGYWICVGDANILSQSMIYSMSKHFPELIPKEEVIPMKRNSF